MSDIKPSAPLVGIAVALPGKTVPNSLSRVIAKLTDSPLRSSEDQRAIRWQTIKPLPINITAQANAEGIDVFELTADQCILPKVVVADMDGTMVIEETLDMVAGYVGVKDKISDLTKAAMDGKIDFRQALESRVGMLVGQPVSLFTRAAQDVRITPGAKEFIVHLRKQGCYCAIATGGFLPVAEVVGRILGFDAVYANHLSESDGRILPQHDDTPVVDEQTKKRILEDLCRKNNVPITRSLAIGDGSNDVPMIVTAGLGISFRGKPVVKQSADIHVAVNDLSAMQYLPFMQGWQSP